MSGKIKNYGYNYIIASLESLCALLSIVQLQLMWIFSQPLLFVAFPHALMLPFITISRFMQEVHILKNVKLIDSPGIVASPSNPPVSLALRSLQVEEGKESVLEAVRTLLKQCDKTQVRRVSLTEDMYHVMCG